MSGKDVKDAKADKSKEDGFVFSRGYASFRGPSVEAAVAPFLHLVPEQYVAARLRALCQVLMFPRSLLLCCAQLHRRSAEAGW
jgi:hypothetical protein